MRARRSRSWGRLMARLLPEARVDLLHFRLLGNCMPHTVADMSLPVSSFTAVIDLWGNVAAFAREIDEPYENTQQWRRNDSIPGRAFAAIVRAAEARGFPQVTHELLCGFAEAKHAARQ